ncbi:MAG: adenylate/guanylate cyclase domain-containing protein [Planctomycetota bacterium]
MPAQDPRERRTVTVLFSDLSGFTRMSETLDPEDVSDIVDKLFLRFRTVIEAHGGTVDKFIGDAVMAVFGAPVAHEDDPARAVRAGLALQRELAAFDAERDLGIRMRIGINTGEVLWGSVAGDRVTAMGDAVNVAQRMESVARIGAVLVSRATQRAAGRGFRFEGRGSVQVKGRQEPVDTVEVVEEIAEAAEAATGVPLVGRETELARLLALFDAGRGAFVAIEGETGIGKSRLLDELKRAVKARRPDAWVASGRAVEPAGLPLAAPGEIARAATSADGAALPEALAAQMSALPATPTERENWGQLIALSAGVALPDARVKAIEPSRMLAETHHAWGRWIAARAAAAPALLCLDDLHWADEGTRALLESFPAALANVPVLVVAAARPGALSRIPGAFERITLGNLTRDAAARLSESVVGAAVSGELATFLFEKSGGNPLFLESLAGYLRSESLLEGSPARLRGAIERIPDGLQGLLVARLDALSPASKEALKAASVLGKIFWPGALAAITGSPVEAALEAAQKQDLVARDPDSIVSGDAQWTFRHALLKDAAYSLLPRRERARLHGLAADHFQSRASQGGRVLQSLAAAQREAGGQAAEAALLWRQSAAAALDDGAYLESLESATRSVALAPSASGFEAQARAFRMLSRLDEALAAAAAAERANDVTPVQRGVLLLLVARVDQTRGRLREAVEGTDRAMEFELGPIRLADALILKANLLLGLARAAEVEEVLNRGRALQPALLADGDRFATGTLASLKVIEGEFARFQGRPAEAESLIREALEMFRGLGFKAGVSNALSRLSNVYGSQGRLDEEARTLTETLALKREAGDREGTAVVLGNLGTNRQRRGRTVEALELFKEALAIHRDTGGRPGIGIQLGNIGAILTLQGRWDESLAAYAESLALRREMGYPAGVARVLGNVGVLHHLRGDYAAARKAYEESIAIGRSIDDRPNLSMSLFNLGELLTWQGELDAALGPLGEALSISRTSDSRLGVAGALRVIGQVRLDAGALGPARSALEESLRLCVEARYLALQPEVMATLAELQEEEGRPEEARAGLTEALKLMEEGSDRQMKARTLAQRSRFGTDAASKSDADAALALAGELKDARVQSVALGALSRFRSATGDREGALSDAREAVRLAAPERTPFRERLAVLLDAARAMTAAGDPAGAAACLKEGEASAKRAGARLWLTRFRRAAGTAAK